MIKLDATTIVSYPTPSKWAEYYGKFHRSLVNSLNGRYCVADREDAVEEAFQKLMHKKDVAAYGEKVPQTEADWYWNLHWQARSFLSRIRCRAERHAKYVEFMSREIQDAFTPGFSTDVIDIEELSEILDRALEIFKSEQDISRRDLNIYVLRQRFQVPSKKIAARYRLTVEHVDVIKHRIGKLLKKYGPDCYGQALRRAA